MNQIIWTNFAISELKRIYLYYKMFATPQVAKKVKASILRTVKYLSKHSEIGLIDESLVSLNQNHRYVVVDNYKIIYRILENSIYVIDVFDCRQNPDKMSRNIGIKIQ